MTQYRVFTHYDDVKYIDADSRDEAVSLYHRQMTIEEESDVIFIVDGDKLYKYYKSFSLVRP